MRSLPHDVTMRRISIVVLLIALTACAGWAASHRDEIAPGVRAAGMDIGGQTARSARLELDARAAELRSARIDVSGADGSWTTTNGAVGLVLDVDRILDDAMAVGRSGDPLTRARSIVGAASGAVDLGWPRRTIDDRLDLFVERVATDADRAPVDGDVTIGPTGVVVREPQNGRTVDRRRLSADLLLQRTFTVALRLPTAVLVPVLGLNEIADARDAALDAYAPLPVVAGSESLVIPAPTVATLVHVDRVTTMPEHLVATVDPAAVASLADDVAARLEGPVRNAVLVPGGDRLAVVPGRDGVAVDRVLLRHALAEAIFQSADEGRQLTVPADIAAPALSTAAAEAIASSSVLLGGFTTYFPENAARATNIGNAARTFDGMTVAPGSSFSFWGRIGQVSTRTGYVSAGAIIGGVSDTAIGGGLCQVSTTLFDAVARAGLRIDQRHPHDYYIERYPLGLDAAVFSPWVDLEWTNDSASPITIRAEATATSVSFWLYGPPTGRTVAFLDAVQWNVRYPAPDQAADPAHAPGYVVVGRDVQVTRIVLENGTERSRDVWYSHYAPVWGGPAR